MASSTGRLPLALALVVLPAEAQSWSPTTPATSPSARSLAAIANGDTGTPVFLFGGSTGSAVLGDTWTWSGSQWQSVVTSTAPSARSGAAMAYDRQRHRVVLFGGQNAAGTRLADTWVFDGTNWTQLFPATSPSTRTRAGMCYDRRRDRMVMVGGLTSSGPSGETWEWNGTNWQVRTGPALTARSGAAVVYDFTMQAVTVFGGLGAGGPLADTCLLLTNGWNVFSLPGPVAREGACATYDPVQSRVLLVGGRGAGATLLADAWLWDGNAWTSAAAPALARADAALAYDTTATRAVVFGGLGAAGPLADTQLRSSFSSAPQPLEWRVVANSGPPARSNGAMAFDAARGAAILMGGYWRAPQPFAPTTIVTFGTHADCWSWNGSTWSAIPGGPSARGGAAMCFDSARSRIVLFGGGSTGNPIPATYRGDTWEWNGTAWAQRATAGPPAAEGSCMAFDSQRNVTVLFGGVLNTGPHGETWEWNGTTWTRRTPTSSPPASYYGAMDYDPIAGRTVLHGGASFTVGNLDATWEWDGTNWVQMPGSNPSPMSGHRMHFDSQRGNLVMIDPFALRTWDRIGGTWAERIELQPEPRIGYSSTYDAARQRLVQFGGQRLLSFIYSDQVSPAPIETWECVPGVQPLLDVAGTAIEFGTPCSAEPTRFTAFPASRPAIGREISGIASGLTAYPVVGWVALGLSDRVSQLGALPIPLAALGMPTCSLLQAADIDIAFPMTPIYGSTASFRLAIPVDPVFLGISVFGQAWGPSQTGLIAATISNAIEWRIGSH